MFPKLSVDKISEIHNIINKSNKKDKPILNMIIKDPSRKQVIILIETNNIKEVMT